MKISLILTGKDLDRFNEKWEVSDTLFFNNTPCHIWTAGKDYDGYGHFWYKNKTLKAHRVSYANYNNLTTINLTIDHLCRNTSCINPLHLEIVNMRENTVRGKTSQLNENGTSKYPGVFYHKQNNKWAWAFTFKSKKIRGICDTEEEAAQRYQELLKQVKETGIIHTKPKSTRKPTKGYWFDKQKGKWVVNVKRKHYGSFHTEQEAKEKAEEVIYELSTS